MPPPSPIVSKGGTRLSGNLGDAKSKSSPSTSPSNDPLVSTSIDSKKDDKGRVATPPKRTTDPTVKKAEPKPRGVPPKSTIVKAPFVKPTTATGTSYDVKDNDSYWSISASVYGNGKHWKRIADANPRFKDRGIHPGDTLTIPPRPAEPKVVPKTDPKAAPKVTTKPPKDGSKLYEVQKGDTPIGIAKRFYGDGQKYTLLYEANPEIQRTLVAGKTIRIPPAK